jgi:hypothetical protein
VPEGTVASRLARGRALLAQRLTRHGLLGLSAASAAAVWSQQASRALPEALLTRTIKAVGLMAAGQTVTAGLLSTEVPPLTDAVLRAMPAPKWKAAGVVLLLAGLALGGGMVAYLLLVNRPKDALDRPQDHARSVQADEPIIVVTASYPGANALLVADTVAAPIEKLIDEEAEGLVRIESASDNDGNYNAVLRFKPKTDLKSAREDVERGVWRAEPLLPAVVLQNKVSVTIGKAKVVPNQVDIVVIDRLDLGRDELQKRVGAVVKRLEAEHALTKPQVFPGDEVKQLAFDIDLTKCESLGVTKDDLSKAIPAGFSTMQAEELKKLVVRDKVTLGDVAVFKELYVPAAVYRVDGFPAIRITGAPPDGKSVAAAAAKCVDLTEAEVKSLDRPGYRGFAVKNLSAK